MVRAQTAVERLLDMYHDVCLCDGMQTRNIDISYLSKLATTFYFKQNTKTITHNYKLIIIKATYAILI